MAEISITKAQSNVISVRRGWVSGCQFAGKKHYITLEVIMAWTIKTEGDGS